MVFVHVKCSTNMGEHRSHKQVVEYFCDTLHVMRMKGTGAMHINVLLFICSSGSGLKDGELHRSVPKCKGTIFMFCVVCVAA